jgi:hypothetical protein
VGAGVHAAWYTIDCHSHHSISWFNHYAIVLVEVPVVSFVQQW